MAIKSLGLLVVGFVVGGLIIAPIAYGKGKKFNSGTTQANSTAITPSAYKKLFKDAGADEFNAEVPSNWSIYINGENSFDSLGDRPTYAVGQDSVAFGDTNWNQVDFYFVQNDIIDDLIKKAKAEDSDSQRWTKETIDGVTADVYTMPLDNGQVTKGGSGGKLYYIRLPYTSAGSAKTLFIRKQALGDEAFEAGVSHLIKDLKLGKQ